MNMKKSHILLIVMIFSVTLFAAYTYNDENSTASILSVSDTTFDTVDGETTYMVVSFTQQVDATEKITTKVTEDINGEIDGDGQSVEGEMIADFALDVTGLGWEMDVVKDTTNPYVDHIEDVQDGWWITDGSVDLDHEYSSSGITYYKLADETWGINSVYEPKVTIKEKTYTAGMRTYGKDTSGTRIEIQGDADKPPIYYEEAMFAFGSSTTTAPQLGNIQIIPYGGTKMFVDSDNMDVETIVNEWNHVLSGGDGLFVEGDDVNDRRETIDLNGDDESDMDGIDKDISLETFVTNDWTYKPSRYSSYHSLINPMDYEFKNSAGKTVDYDQYELQTGGDASLVYETPMMIVGTWHIPIEYGDIVITELNPIPEITAFGTVGDLTDDGTGSYSVTVKCTDGEGRISVQLIQDAKKEVPITIEPDSILYKTFETGEEITYIFSLIGNDINTDDENVFMILATGSGGAQDTKYDTIEMIDADAYSEEDMVSITIDAISIIDDEPLPNHPIIVNGDTQYGTWEGKVIPNIDVEVTGEEFEGYTPKSAQTIKATANGQTFDFIYTPPTGGHDDGFNWWLVGTIGVIVILILGTSVYFVTKGKKK